MGAGTGTGVGSESGGGVGIDGTVVVPIVDTCRRCFTTSVARATSSSWRCSGVKCPYRCESGRPEGQEHSMNRVDRVPDEIFGAMVRQRLIVCGRLATLRVH